MTKKTKKKLTQPKSSWMLDYDPDVNDDHDYCSECGHPLRHYPGCAKEKSHQEITGEE